MIIFVDDLNMPAPEFYGAQPAIELLRQYMDHKGWFDRKTNHFKKIQDIQFVAAMQGESSRTITSRYLRHYNIISVQSFNDEDLTTIYSTISDNILRNSTTIAQQSSDSVVKASIDLYRSVVSEFLPTPNKSHYTFNLRDLAQVFQGILSVSNDCILLYL